MFAEAHVALMDEDRENTWKGIQGLEQCTGLRWVLFHIEGPSSTRPEVDRCVDDMRELFEQVAMKCQPEKGLHVVKVKRYTDSDGTDIVRDVVQGAWERYGRDNNDGNGVYEVLAESNSHSDADSRLRKNQDWLNL